MAADGADSVHVWKSKVLNVQLKKKVLLLRVWSCRTFTVVSSVLLKQWFSYPLIPSLWWWTGKKKKANTDILLIRNAVQIHFHAHKESQLPNIWWVPQHCYDAQLCRASNGKFPFRRTKGSCNYCYPQLFHFLLFFFFCTVFTECPQVCLLHLAPSCHPFGQNLDSIAPQSQ